MFISLRPAEVEVVAGSSAVIEVTVLDPDGGSLEGLSVTFAGVEPSWVSRVDGSPVDAPLEVSGDRATARFALSVPVDHPAGDRLIALGIRALTGGRGAAFERVPLSVVERPGVRVTTDPIVADGRGRVTVSLVISSDSTRDLVVVPIGEDPEGVVDFEFDRSRVEVPSGADRSVGVRLRGGRPLIGRSQRRVVRVGVDAGDRVVADLAVVRRPILPMPLLAGVVGLLGVMLVLLFGSTTWFDRSSSSPQAVPDGDVLEVIDLERSGATVSGALVDSVGGDPVTGLTVELFEIGDPLDPVRVAATGGDGRYELDGVGPGSYNLRVSGPGFVTSWFGDVDQFDAAASIEVAAEDVELDPVRVAGRAARILGRLSGSDLDGLVVTALAIGVDVAPVTATVEGGTGGVFDLGGLAAPARHRLTVTRGDRTLTSLEVDLVAGDERGDLTIVIPAGDGVITGLVTTAAGPLGGATVVVTDGTNDVATSSLSLGDIGTFSVEGLELPGRYTVSVMRDGFASALTAVDLTVDGSSAVVDVELMPAAGSITGRVVDSDGVGLGGVSVRASADGYSQATVSVDGSATIEAGRFILTGLPAPSSLTLTFSADGHLTSTQQVSLGDPTSGPREVSASLERSTATVTGVVVGPDGDPIAGATLVLSDGVRTTTTRSAHEPLGGYEFAQVAPGSHTISVRVPGAAPVVVLIEPAAGESVTSDIGVGVSATVGGRVVSSASTAPAVPVDGATVRLIPLARFPGSNADAVASTTTGPDGRFTLRGFGTPGDYVVAISTPTAPAVVVASVTVRPLSGMASNVGDVDLAG